MYGVLIVPLRRRQRVLGTIALFRGQPDRPYSEEDRTFVQNIADRAGLALENAQLVHQIQEAVRLREEFLSIASHEMRTPLTTISGFATLLDRQVSSGQIDADRVSMISGNLMQETRRLVRLVEDLLDVARIEQNRLDIRPEECDLSSIIAEVVTRISESAEISQNRDIVVDAPEAVPGFWDRLRIDQVITNLLTNALKYSADGQITLSAWVEDANTAVLQVSDEGAGIAADQLLSLFEPFKRGADAHHSASGTGLGLYITRKIIDHHGGTISVESDPSRGTTFTVRLPLKPEANES
jgi:signal transduction histidine kinase